MTNTAQIDYDRLELIVAGDIHESCRAEFDIPTICAKARIKNGTIIVSCSKFRFTYDLNTYQQLSGIGG